MLIINTLIALHLFHPFARNPGVSRDTLGGVGNSVDLLTKVVMFNRQ